MGLLDALKDRQFWGDVGNNTNQLARAASDTVASNVTGPVDLLSWILKKGGVPVGDAPVGGSQWATNAGLLNGPQPNKLAQLAGETMGLLGPIGVAAKAPQIARGLLSLDDKAMDVARRGIEKHMVNNGLIQPATVWHGSPHKFDKFDASKIGTGEGAQAYGHGLYVAENPSVATEYSKMSAAGGAIPSPVRTIHGVEVQPGTGQYKAASLLDSMSVSQARKTVDGWLQNARPDEVAYFKEVADTLATIPGKAAVKQRAPGGNLYKIDLPDEHIAKMLDWDKPLSQQAPGVQKMLEPLGYSTKSQIAKHDDDLLNALLNDGKAPLKISDPMGSDIARGGGLFDRADQIKKAKRLQELGIPGIRYLDGGSRGAGTGSSNYVVFPGNEGLLNILERNGKPVK
jgi:hypothetical protein